MRAECQKGKQEGRCLRKEGYASVVVTLEDCRVRAHLLRINRYVPPNTYTCYSRARRSKSFFRQICQDWQESTTVGKTDDKKRNLKRRQRR